MAIVTFYRGDPEHTPKTTMPAHLGANAVMTWNGKLLLEKRRDSDIWGLIGGGTKKTESSLQGMVREIYEELGIRIPKEKLKKLDVYGEPGRVAAFQDGSIWRMVIVVFGYEFETEPILKISAESKELRFFSKEEIADIEIAVTHADIVEDWFLHGGRENCD